MGSLKSSCVISYKSSRDHSCKLLTFSENCIYMYAFWRQTERQTDRQTNRWTELMRESAVAIVSVTPPTDKR